MRCTKCFYKTLQITFHLKRYHTNAVTAMILIDFVKFYPVFHLKHINVCNPRINMLKYHFFLLKSFFFALFSLTCKDSYWSSFKNKGISYPIF